MLFSISAFVVAAKTSSKHAALTFNVSEIDVFFAIEQLQNCLPFQLFTSQEILSNETLTKEGEGFLPYAEEALSMIDTGIEKSILDLENANNILKIKLTPAFGKNIVAMSIPQCNTYNLNIDIDVTLDVTKHPLQFAVYCGQIHDEYIDYFNAKWTAIIKQGIFVSESYASDIGIPTNIDDISAHTTILCSDEFGKLHEKYNWFFSLICKKQLQSSIFVTNPIAIHASISAGLGIGSSLIHTSNDLIRVFPEINGPDVYVTFFVRKSVSQIFVKYIEDLETSLFSRLTESNVEIIDGLLREKKCV